MARHVYHPISFFCLSTILYTLCYADSSSPCLQQKQTPLFVFGDSQSDAGNNNYLNNTSFNKANHSPYGMTFFKFPTGRFTNGRTVPDFIAEYAEIPLIPPYLQPGYHRFTDGANFASGGAGILDDTNQEVAVPLKTQLEYFKNVEKQLRKKLGDAEGRALVSRAVYLMNIGSNDYLLPFIINSSSIKLYPQKYVGMVIRNLTIAIKDVYEKGGRKFWVPNLAPIGCAPFLRVSYDSCLEEANALAKLHNQELLKMLQKLETQLEGFKYSTSDFYSFLLDMINFPSRHSLKDGKKACCGSGSFGGNKLRMNFEACEDPSDYVFFDAAHPTEAVYQEFARIVWNGTRDQTWPYNLKELFEAN
ncbi:hypothetical protein QN277_022233 [Acacia crassicarpa]|uniref:GDSL esterase/lipase n=1 Tax=Acacia crassicarpa TaxID=499986 RepID=A0AAE1JJ81_9FABA|nr:hypothetical protein QN277_022233 [Acacia crassicarpa]